MLHCIYHPLLEPQVVDDLQKDRLLATGVWFDHPKKASDARKYYEDKVSKEIKNEKRRKK